VYFPGKEFLIQSNVSQWPNIAS